MLATFFISCAAVIANVALTEAAPGPDPIVSWYYKGKFVCVNDPMRMNGREHFRTVPEEWRKRDEETTIPGPRGDADHAWVMLRAYVEGSGRENKEWIYVNDVKNSSCLTHWTYYDQNGNVKIDPFGTEISNATTLQTADGRWWCPLPVYTNARDPAIFKGKTWKYCGKCELDKNNCVKCNE